MERFFFGRPSRHLVTRFVRQDIRVNLVRMRRLPSWISEVREYKLVFLKRQSYRKWKQFAELDQDDVDLVRQLLRDAEKYLNGVS